MSEPQLFLPPFPTLPTRPPTVVIGEHLHPESQIRRLKEGGILEKFARTVRDRDTLYQGSINPSLPVSGNTTGGEARVYAGKAHPAGEIWKCPFHANKSK